MNVKEFGIEHVTILPPRKGVCQVCAAEHDPAMPHNRDSLYYQMRFYQEKGRFPTWADAMAHCDQSTQTVLTALLLQHGATLDGIFGIETGPEEPEDGS